MLPLILRRLAQLPIILLVIYTVTLWLAWRIPGNPLENPEGRRPPAAIQEAMQRQYNLHSFPAFYTSYLANATGIRSLVRGTGPEAPGAPARAVFDLGPSLQYEDWRVNEILADALPVSITLGALAIAIALAIGVTTGVIGAWRPGSLADHATLALALVGVSLPSFVVGSLLLLVFGVWIAWMPVGGWGRPADMVLPALTLSLPFAAYIARLTRMGMLEQLSADYITTARSKGVREGAIYLRHALKNAFLPVLSFLGPAGALAMTGSFVVERVFSVPGIGQHFVNAVQNKDLFLIIGVVLVLATMMVLFNLAVDVLYRWVDPRIE
ncbi:MAG: ABC transporter permease [Phycisphaeraceae bacterium]|nr:ABC transporter permease [Phycisphaeraceae bacterium]